MTIHSEMKRKSPQLISGDMSKNRMEGMEWYVDFRMLADLELISICFTPQYHCFAAFSHSICEFCSNRTIQCQKRTENAI